MSRRYRFIIAGAVTAVLVAIGGIAVAESGGQSADHRKNPPTTTSQPAAPTQPTVTTEAPQKPQGDDGENDGVEGQGSSEFPGNSEWARCQNALNNGSEIAQWNKAQAPAFAGCDSALTGTARPEPGNGGAPANSNAGGNGGGGNPHAESGGGNPHGGPPGHNK
jgi:hypothetical protein